MFLFAAYKDESRQKKDENIGMCTEVVMLGSCTKCNLSLPASSVAKSVGISLRIFFTNILMSTNFSAYNKPGKDQ